MAQLLYHLTAAKAISSQVLAATPDPSHWRDSFERGVETLNYAKQVVQSLHPTGYDYLVYMDTFFHTQTGIITEGPRAKEEGQPLGYHQHKQVPPLRKLKSRKLSKLNHLKAPLPVKHQTCTGQVLLQ